MASWNDVVSYLNGNFKCEQESESMLTLLFGMPGGRSQVVWVEHAGNDQIGEWATVSSAVGSAKDTKKLASLCREAKRVVLGGIVIDGDLIMIRDSFPLVNLDINELELPLKVIVSAADLLESQITGGDDY